VTWATIFRAPIAGNSHDEANAVIRRTARSERRRLRLVDRATSGRARRPR
jgi:hypothetical protein